MSWGYFFFRTGKWILAIVVECDVDGWLMTFERFFRSIIFSSYGAGMTKNKALKLITILFFAQQK